MKYNFDEVIDRKGTNSVKWDGQSEEVIPMWIADMDFRVAPPITAALNQRLSHGIFGYASVPEAYFAAEVNWWQNRHGTQIRKEWIEVTTGIIPALSAVVQAFCSPGDKVMIQNPVYNYFISSITNNGCEAVVNQLAYDGDVYTIDFTDFEKKAADERVKMFILCNPHNPVGRVWTEDELIRMGEICLEHDVLVLVDEAHRDLVYAPNIHIPFMGINERFKANAITCTSPGKTFNLAGLKIANIITANEAFRLKVNRSINVNEVIEPNIFGIDATIAAYEEGESWVDQMLAYLKDNASYVRHFLDEHLPHVKMTDLEGTYLVWLDCHQIDKTSDTIAEELWHIDKVRVNSGSVYGQGGQGFIRINIACPRALLEEGLTRLAASLSLE